MGNYINMMVITTATMKNERATPSGPPWMGMAAPASRARGPLAPQYYANVVRFYLEAVRRLPSPTSPTSPTASHVEASPTPSPTSPSPPSERSRGHPPRECSADDAIEKTGKKTKK